MTRAKMAPYAAKRHPVMSARVLNSSRESTVNKVYIKYIFIFVLSLRLIIVYIYFSAKRALYVGNSPLQRNKVDAIAVRAYVFNQRLPMSGEIDKVDFYATYGNRPISIGIYKHVSGCTYQAIQTITLQNIQVGLNQVNIENKNHDVFILYFDPRAYV